MTRADRPSCRYAQVPRVCSLRDLCTSTVREFLNETLNGFLNEGGGRRRHDVDSGPVPRRPSVFVACTPTRALFRDNPSQEEHDLPIKLTFTVQEAADLLGISRSTAYECVHRGDLPALTLGRRLLVTRATLESMLGALPDHRVVASGDADS